MEKRLVGFKSKKTRWCFPALVLPDGAFEVQIVQDICIKDYVCLGVLQKTWNVMICSKSSGNNASKAGCGISHEDNQRVLTPWVATRGRVPAAAALLPPAVFTCVDRLNPSDCVCSGERRRPEWTHSGGGGFPAQGHAHGRGRGAAGSTTGGPLPSPRGGEFVVVVASATLLPPSHFTSIRCTHACP